MSLSKAKIRHVDVAPLCWGVFFSRTNSTAIPSALIVTHKSFTEHRWYREFSLKLLK